MSAANGGPAFPSKRRVMRAGYFTNEFEPVDGMSMRHYAAIALKVPDSGHDWLDAMIIESRRDDLAAKALPAVMCANGSWHDNGFKPADGKSIMENHALFAYQIADAMLAARKGGAS